MHQLTSITAIVGALGLICFAGTSRADNYTTKVVQASGANWNAAIWQLNGAGPSLAPTAGNTYELVANGVAVGNNLAETRVRNPATAGVQTFPGDSLTLNTNTEIRMKTSGAILNFPGVGGKPGLILNGGVLNSGDDAVFEVRGSIGVTAQSYIMPGNNDGANGVAARAVNISGQLSGSGTLVIIEALTNTAQQISGNSNTFSGKWIVKTGWLLGSGTDSLGTNSITMDPGFVIPIPPFSDTAPVVDVTGFPAVLEVNYDINSAGTLTLINGGVMRLHQNCTFSAVIIEGTALTRGTHPYSELVANFPNNFDPGGSGSITVQPYVNVLRPQISTQPLPQMLYAGRTARFTVGASGTPPFSYQWRKGGVNLTDGGNISGATNATLVISNVTTADGVAYDVVVSNSGGSATSTPVNLTIVTPSGEAYETAVIAANPVAFYQLNETTDPATGPVAFDFAGGFLGTYGTQVQNGNANYNIAGPLPASGFPGFSSNNKAALFSNNSGNARITVNPWNLNTNTVSITAWINPNGPQIGFEAIAFCRGGGTVAGLNYSAGFDANNNSTLGYHWNNEADTYNWNSGLVPAPGQWSFVALVVTPTNATISVINANGLVSSTHVYNHVVQTFGGATLIGDDSNDAGSGARVFNGTIDDVAVFNTALSAAQLASLYSAASGVKTFAPTIGGQPVTQTLYAQQTAQFTVAAGGTEPLSYQWKKGTSGSYVNLTDGGRISGSKTAVLTINNINASDSADYVVTISNAYGTITSDPASLGVMPTSPAEHITMSIQQAAGSDWNTGADWSDGLAASESAAAKPGSTYEVLAGARFRTPTGNTVATFPGNVLTLDGDGVWVNNPAATNTTICEIRFKQPNPGTVIFKKLVMNGGQLDSGNPGVVVIGGEIDILTNTPIYNDDTSDRGYRIDAWLTGTGTIEYHAYNQTSFVPTYVNNLNIAGTSNTFSGKWNVVLGVLLGTGLNSLGTNNITVGPTGALETTYDINNPSGSLVLNGMMYLHQNDKFRVVVVNGITLSAGTYTFTQLNSQFPTNFPATWMPQTGAASFSTGSGSVTVLGQSPPSIVTQPASQSLVAGLSAQFTVTVEGSQPISYQWQVRAVGSSAFVNLADGGQISGAKTANLTINNLAAANAGDYVVVVSNAVRSVTSSTATLTVSPPGHYTTTVVQAGGTDWNTNIWQLDGTGTAVSPVPGNTYECVANGTAYGTSTANTRVRNPAVAGVQTFPGTSLILNTNTELRMKAAGAIPDFPGFGDNPGLILKGGLINGGDTTVFTVTGKVRVDSQSYITMGDNGGGAPVVGRAVVLACQLSGSGTMVIFQCATNDAQMLSGSSNTFSGQWIVKAGWLQGWASNSLGTNSITIDPGFVLPPDFDPGVVETTGPAVLEVNYDINSAGTLTLTNGGLMRLHQRCVFSAVKIEGTALSPGPHPYSELAAKFPNNFEAGGSGSITVGAVAPPPVTLLLQGSGSSRQLSWSQGTLLEATSVTGPWTPNNASSPFPVTPTGTMKFYKVRVQ